MSSLRGWMKGSTVGKGVSVAVVVLAGVLLTWVVVAAQSGSDFEGMKTGPRFVENGEMFTYTIEVTNTTDATVVGATLTDELPTGLTFEDCYYVVGGTAAMPCTPPDLWTLSVPPGALVRTTLVVRANAGTAVFSILNTAELGWASYILPLGPVTTTLSPLQTYLPFVARNFGP